MRDAAEEAISFAKDRSMEELYRDRMLLLSLVKELEIIGEAAGRVSEELKTEFPYVPWETAAGMRNRLIHAYFDISADVVWVTVKEDLPALIQTLDELLESA
jgi:uncharacterized protein with HEPN domain